MAYKKLIIFIAIAVVFIGFAVKTSFFYAPKCESFECFSEKMRECKPANFLNDDAEATWRYNIKGVKDGACVIEVTLLQSKTGELGMQNLVGYKMECGFPKSVVTYPETDLGACHGRLKEELQAIIIEKLHTYIVNNLGEIDQTLDLIVQ